MIEPVALASLTSAVTMLGTEVLKGLGGEAGKATWAQIKSLFGWTADPAPADLATSTAEALTAAPHLAEPLTGILQQSNSTASQLVGNLKVESGGKVVVAQTVQNLTM